MSQDLATKRRERGLIFTETVPALLDGSKSQSRRIVRDAPADTVEVVPSLLAHRGDLFDFRRHLDNPVAIRCPYGAPGDALWVRESWFLYESEKHNPWPDLPSRRGPDGFAFYRHGFDRAGRRRWRSPMFMPRWASRITLELTSVRVQRLQDITEEDARAEGVRFDGRWWLGAPHPIKESPKVFPTARQAFESLWDSINGNRRRREPLQLGDPGHTVDKPYRTVRDDSATWAANPWVWVLGFRRVEAP